ncbi:MAG: ComEC/Rec2 family competence protein [Chloroflexia bacterium]
MSLRTRDWAWLAGLLALLVGVVLLAAALEQRPDGLLHFWALDVGQGDALLIGTPGGHDVLVDGGPDPAVTATRLGQHMPFWQRDISMVILTHPHEDHISGLIEVLKRYRVDSVLETPFEQGNQALENEWHGQLALAHTSVTYAEDGQTVAVEPGLSLHVLYPPAQLLSGTHSDINNSSVVVRLDYGSVRMLLTGDVETEAVHELLARERGALHAQVLKVPHHGSSTGLSPDLLAAVAPSVAVISVGRGNLYGHPAPSTLNLLRQAGVPTYRTDEHGTVEVLSDGRQVWVRAER